MLKCRFYGEGYVSLHKFKELTWVNKHECRAYFEGNYNKNKV